MAEREEPNLTQMPDDVLASIFFKLPIPTLFHCKYVCKSWRRWFSNPNFTKTLFSRTRNTWVLIRGCTPSNISGQDLNYFLVAMENPTPEHGNYFLVDIMNCGYRNNYLAALKLPKDPNLPTKAKLLGSCNGLLLLEDCRSSKYYISNPITGESLALPPCTKDGKVSSSQKEKNKLSGIAFSPISHVCKVFLMRPTNGTGMILTVGSGIWRSIRNFKHQNTYPQHLVQVNGFLHWIIDWSGKLCTNSTISICAFDVEHEQIGQALQGPTLKDECCWGFQVQVWRGFLSLVADTDGRFIFWVMMEYGISESWTKVFITKKMVPLETPKSLEEKQAWIFYLLHASTIITMNHMRDTEVIKGIPSKINSALFVYTPSFTLLNDMIRG